MAGEKLTAIGREPVVCDETTADESLKGTLYLLIKVAAYQVLPYQVLFVRAEDRGPLRGGQHCQVDRRQHLPRLQLLQTMPTRGSLSTRRFPSKRCHEILERLQPVGQVHVGNPRWILVFGFLILECERDVTSGLVDLVDLSAAGR